ncbi:hypothetical protein JIR001_23420 [Polycladomyces abyssicola]|uniref:Uncharacterized protein n=1 Tax=Polycladomyces abyssicola TaxID=1125966 RepID=A0A8D5ZLI6_9BACL|nr:hypothetical protein JIR001_23420 [Polycladomyces abyssicola]
MVNEAVVLQKRQVPLFRLAPSSLEKRREEKEHPGETEYSHALGVPTQPQQWFRQQKT